MSGFTSTFVSGAVWALFATFTASAALAQGPGASEGASEAINPNIGHRHHEHPHGHPHETTLDASRFHTDRASAQILPLPVEEDAFTFVVFGDRTGGPADGVAILADAVRDTNLIDPDFVITVGDLIQGYNEEPEWLEQMEEYKGIMDRLKCPWFPVAGNHDIYWRDTDGSGDEKPEGEHEKNYETHFGPLWYAFEHKDAWFIVLFSDEGNPETGRKTFKEPESQQMSDEQFDWLKETLEKAKDASNVFLFLHHPRWIGGGRYGDGWEKVHEALVEAGNVRAVFGGHIHHMRYDPRDGIEYVTLATVGGRNAMTVPRAGMLHHYNLVTVRPDQISMSTIPVGAAIDPRQITRDLQAAARRLADYEVEIDGRLRPGADGAVRQDVTLKLENPTDYPLHVTVTPSSTDSRWVFGPDHDHLELAPGQRRDIPLRVSRAASTIDASFRPAEVEVAFELLTDTFRYAIPTSRTRIATDISSLRQGVAERQAVLHLDGQSGHVVIPSAQAEFHGEPFTVEAWVNADDYTGRRGLLSKVHNSAYGLFVSNGMPQFLVRFGGRYVRARAASPRLEPGRWHHVAGVYDGSSVRLYVDGQLVDTKQPPADGAYEGNDLPLIVGGDVAGNGTARSFIDGRIDDVRLSRTARYTGERFEPRRDADADEQDTIVLRFNGQVGSWIFNDGGEPHFELTKGATLLPADGLAD